MDYRVIPLFLIPILIISCIIIILFIPDVKFEHAYICNEITPRKD